MTLTRSQLSSDRLRPQHVFRPVLGGNPGQHLLERVVRSCDGQRNVEQVAQALNLPLSVCLRLIARAVEQGCIEPAEVAALASKQQANLWPEIRQHLSRCIGSELGEQVMQQAACATPGSLRADQLSDYLIALEMQLSEPQFDQLQTVFEQLRATHYG